MEFANTVVAHAVEINRIEISVLLAVIRYSSELTFLREIPREASVAAQQRRPLTRAPQLPPKWESLLLKRRKTVRNPEIFRLP
jgi:hypothetical protein